MDPLSTRKHTLYAMSRKEWALMSFYGRFEQIVALILSLVIAVIIVISLLQLVRTVFGLLFLEAFNPLDHRVFQTVFGMILTLLIAMEFKHSIIKVALRRDNIIQVKTVVLIALIALARKFVILDPEAQPEKIVALALASLALGVVYWLLRERDDRSDGSNSAVHPRTRMRPSLPAASARARNPVSTAS
ncbi:MAG: phosphate-starvation-inducible PsiE family protein [Thiobacillus sp.]|nr:phosphate-starvation-inducible PsiE family protein [Thiobacillus sp.]